MGHRLATAHLLRRLAFALHTAGDPAAAHPALDECLGLCRDLQDAAGLAEGLELLALTLVSTDPARAARVLGAALAARGPRRPAPHAQPLPFSHTRPPLERIPSAPTAATARAVLGEAGFTAAFAAGQGMGVDEGVGSAREDARSV